MRTDLVCELCGSNGIKPVLNLGSHPLCDDLQPIGKVSACTTYPIEVALCENCGTAHQVYQVPKERLFTPSYHYRARLTPSGLSGMKDLVDSCENLLGSLRGLSVVDIGANDGSLLNFFRERGARTLGVEPTDAAKDSDHEMLQTFFDQASVESILGVLGGRPDIITFTNVFAHIENLPQLLDNLSLLIGPHTTLVIENHYLGAILDYGQFDTFYHEHPRTYSLRSFHYIAENLGLTVSKCEFVSRYGGNIRVFLTKEGPLDETVEIRDYMAEFNRLADSVKIWRSEALELISRLKSQLNAPIPAKAFPGRASILLTLLGLSSNDISAIYEIKGSIKTGNYAPATDIPILPEDIFFREKDKYPFILNLAWHIPTEVEANLRSNGFLGEIFHIRHFKRI